jgi:hypothetical protein
VTTALYVGGEKVPLGAYSVLTDTGELITNWKMLDGDTTVRVVPIGMEKHWRYFPACSWTATTSQERARGAKGRKRGDDGPLGWDGTNPIAVALTRATNNNTASRAAILQAVATTTLSDRDLKAVALSKDATLRLAALPQVSFTQLDMARLSRSTQPHLRIIAAAGLRDVKARAVLLNDSNPLVRGALARNDWMTRAELEQLEHDEHVRLDLAANPNTRTEFLTIGVFEGGLFAQIALRNPRMSDMAVMLISNGSLLAGHAAGNPGIDVAAAIKAAATNTDVTRSLARNIPALTRMPSADAVALIEMLTEIGDRQGIETVTRNAVLDPLDQARLAANPLTSHVTLVGLAGNDSISSDIAELVLATADVMHPWDHTNALVALAGNESVPSKVLNAMDFKNPMVANQLKTNESASGHTRQRAIEQVRRLRRLHQQLVTDSLTRNSAGVSRDNETREVPVLHSPVLRPMAVVVSTPETIGARITVQRDSRLAAWGGEVVEVDVRTSGPAIWTEVVLRVDERRARRVDDANALSDPIGLVAHDGHDEHFSLLEPLTTRTNDDTWNEHASNAPTELTESATARVTRHTRRMLNTKTLMNAAMVAVPAPLKTAMKATKHAANATAVMAGEPRGADRVAVIRADLAAAPARLQMLHAETTRDDAVKAGQHHVRLLQASGVLGEHEAAAVIDELENIGRHAARAVDRRHWAWQAREKLRFTAGQRSVIQQILNGDTPDTWTAASSDAP